MNENILRIHNKALEAVRDFKVSESRMIEILMEVDREEVYLVLRYPCLHAYCVDALKLSDQQAYNFSSIARKCVKVPELKVFIDEGKITTSNARTILKELTPENKHTWLALAAEIPQRKLEQEVRKSRGDESYEIKLRINTRFEEKLNRTKDLLAQRLKKHVQTEEALEALLDEFITRHDPVEKANRNVTSVRQTPVLAMKHGIRKAIPAPLTHQVHQRDQRKCTALKPDATRCNESKWTEIHHVVPISEGGKHELSNLVTLCSGHHKLQHLPYGKIQGNFGRNGRGPTLRK